jgi:hypothetical protein
MVGDVTDKVDFSVPGMGVATHCGINFRSFFSEKDLLTEVYLRH